MGTVIIIVVLVFIANFLYRISKNLESNKVSQLANDLASRLMSESTAGTRQIVQHFNRLNYNLDAKVSILLNFEYLLLMSTYTEIAAKNQLPAYKNIQFINQCYLALGERLINFLDNNAATFFLSLRSKATDYETSKVMTDPKDCLMLTCGIFCVRANNIIGLKSDDLQLLEIDVAKRLSELKVSSFMPV